MNNSKSSPSKARLKRKNNTPHQTRNDSASAPNFASTLKSSLKGAGFALVIGSVLVLLSSFIAYASPDPDKLTLPLSLSSLYISAFLGGVISAKINRASALLTGSLCGVYILVVMFFASMFFPDELSSWSNVGVRILLHALVLVSSVAGAYLGVNRNQGNRKHRKH